MIKTLLSIAARGGFKIGFIIIIISIFTAIAVAINTVSYSYANEAPILREIAGKPNIIILNNSTENSISIKAYQIHINNTIATIISSDDLKDLLNILYINFNGKLPGYGEALIGEKLTTLISGKININGYILNTSGMITSPSQFSNTIIISDKTAEFIKGLKDKELYITRLVNGSVVTEAPSLRMIVKNVAGEGLRSLSIITYLIYMLLSIAVAVEGYSIALNTKNIFKVFINLNISTYKIISSLIILSILTSLLSIIIGYAIGIFTPSIISLFLSISLYLPYIKPLINFNLLTILIISFIISSIFLTIGFLRGYISVLKNY